MMKILKLKPVHLFNLLWLLGLLHIICYGFRPYRHYIFEDMIFPDAQAVILTGSVYSLFFIAGNMLRWTPFWNSSRYWSYVFLSFILIFQAFIAFAGAMHAPPYWAALILNCMFLLLAHFAFYPIYALTKKQLQKKNTS